MEIVVDAYNEQERAMGWYCYLGAINSSSRSRPSVPTSARISPLEKGDEVEVTGMAPESECEHEMFVEMRWEKRNLAVPLSQLQMTRRGQGNEGSGG